jgi:hypothetical protein
MIQLASTKLFGIKETGIYKIINFCTQTIILLKKIVNFIYCLSSVGSNSKIW